MLWVRFRSGADRGVQKRFSYLRRAVTVRWVLQKNSHGVARTAGWCYAQEPGVWWLSLARDSEAPVRGDVVARPLPDREQISRVTR